MMSTVVLHCRFFCHFFKTTSRTYVRSFVLAGAREGSKAASSLGCESFKNDKKTGNRTIRSGTHRLAAGEEETWDT